jgi:hypothetical protein
MKSDTIVNGGMAEWLKAAVLKAVSVVPASLTKSTNPLRNHRVWAVLLFI